jgi:polyisoprenoid-binding protein YceI
MRRHLPFASLLLAAAGMLPSLALADTYDIDSSHTAAQFSVKHMMVTTVRGELGKVTGTVSYDPKAPDKSSVDVSIDMNGITTREEKRDAHLKSPDFFDVAKFPTATFKSKKVTAAGKGKFKVIGDLTMHGVTKEVPLEVEVSEPIKDPWGNTKLGATATGKVNRQEFGVKWSKALDGGGTVVGDDVAITIDAEMAKKAPAAAGAPPKK